MADPLIDDLNLPDRSDVYAAPDPTVPLPLHRLVPEPKPSGDFDRDRVQRVQAAALVILATATVLTLMSVAKLILIVILTSILMAFVLAPLADATAHSSAGPDPLHFQSLPEDRVADHER